VSIDRPGALGRTEDGARDGVVVVDRGRRADARRDGWDGMATTAMGTRRRRVRRRTRGDVGGGARAKRWEWW
jgi:hypothetical protein